MNCPKVLDEAIEGLYVAFSGYPLPEDTMPCDGCHDLGANDLLHAAPLRELQWKHLDAYATDALMVWGDLDCYKHFLPRIFELILTAGQWPKTPNPELVFHILRYGQWRTWPKEEQKAIERMLQAVWETVRSNPPIEGGYIDVDQWLCCISRCEDDLAPYLDEWMKDERLSAAWALSSLILGSEIAYTGADTNHDPPVWEGEESRARIEEWSKLPHRGPFWKGSDAQYSQLQEWVTSRAALENCISPKRAAGTVKWSANSGPLSSAFSRRHQPNLNVSIESDDFRQPTGDRRPIGYIEHSCPTVGNPEVILRVSPSGAI